MKKPCLLGVRRVLTILRSLLNMFPWLRERRHRWRWTTLISLIVLISLFAQFRQWQIAREHEPYARNVTISTRLPALQKYKFRSVWVPSIYAWTGIHPCCFPVLVAVGPDGRAYKMPRDFTKLLRAEHLSATSPKEALDLAWTYVHLTEGMGRILVISELRMIPGVDANPPENHPAIASPAVNDSGKGYVVHIFTWKELSGDVQEWLITFSKHDLHVQRATLAYGVGKSFGLG
jgi:hypothetical protein